jgi:hypothetical protein
MLIATKTRFNTRQALFELLFIIILIREIITWLRIKYEKHQILS